MCDVETASCLRDLPATRPAVDAPVEDFVVQPACCPVVDGLVAVADLAVLLLALADSQSCPDEPCVVAADLVVESSLAAVVVVSRRCLADFAAPSADDLVAAGQSVVVACWNCLVAAGAARFAVFLLAAVFVDPVGAELAFDRAPRSFAAASAFRRAFPAGAPFLAPSVCPVDLGLKEPEQPNREVPILLL